MADKGRNREAGIMDISEQTSEREAPWQEKVGLSSGLADTVLSGPYEGQTILGTSCAPFSGWIEAFLIDERGHKALRDIRQTRLRDQK
jgi:hypothetical protein